jgi:hypothetical protein
VSEPITCDLCGTVNVVAAEKCMACGQEFVRPVSASDPDPGPEPEIHARDEIGDLNEPTPHTASSPNHHRQMETDLQHERKRKKRKKRPEAETSGDDTVRYVVRLLLPEGERRSFEVGRKPITLGSGLDEVGLTGDPRVSEGEASLYVSDGRLWIDPEEDSRNVYVRMRDEEELHDGDVVLMGDIAAAFSPLEPVAVADGAGHALGGSANAACGRLRFLRRDGSDGPIHDLPAGKTVVGRTDGHLNFPHDTRLSRRHVRFFASEGGVSVEDLDSRNGTYLRLRTRTALSVGDSLRVGSSGIQIRDRISTDE